MLQLVPEYGGAGNRDVELDYWRASARYALEAPNRIKGYAHADMSVFESIALNARDAVPTAFNAAIKVFAHRAKTGVGELQAWAPLLERAVADATPKVDGFTADLLSSRFYRSLAFLPQQQKDAAEVIRLMDAAERHALRMQPSTPGEKLICLENLHPVMESRTKEALWLGELDVALERAKKVIELDPYDSKAHVELGQVYMAREEWAKAAEAYVIAGMLGPPASAIGRYMAGLCFRRCGQETLAAFFYKETLEIDPLGISPHHEIHDLPNSTVTDVLRNWSLSAF